MQFFTLFFSIFLIINTSYSASLQTDDFNFSVKQANQVFDKINLELSVQNLKLGPLSAAVNTLTKLTTEANRCVDETQKKIDNLDNLINSELDRILTDSGKNIAGVEEIWQAHRNVYEKIGQPGWANAIYEAYVKKFNVPYK